ncbi:MAG: DUF63 family protein [Methanotrichaceae archaeon]
MIHELSDWIYRSYVYPIIYDTGYNPVNTVTWAIILGIAVLGLIRLFRRLDLHMDEGLVLYTLPYIFAGASLRVIEDTGMVAPPWRYLLITPLIYFLVFLVTFTSLLLNRKIFGTDFYKGYAAIGLIWTVLNISALAAVGLKNAWVILLVSVLGSGFAGLLFILRLGIPWLGFLNDSFNMMIIYVHMLDASSTYIGVDWFGYYEKHVVPTFIINLTGTAAVMYPLKLLVLLPALSLIDKSLEDPSLRNLAKLALIILGLAPAVRNTLRLALGI